MSTITVVGSVNLDLVVVAPRLPRPGETVTDGLFSRYPGGKGANQALAARRQGAIVELVAAVGDDWAAEEALAILARSGVGLDRVVRLTGCSTGIALITVDSAGENTVVVAPGANRELTPDHVGPCHADAVIGQLEVSPEVVEAAARTSDGLFCLNAAPVRTVADAVLRRADVVVVNEVERRSFGDRLSLTGGLVVVTKGSEGAVAYRGGAEVARATPPTVDVVDTVGAGDAFVAALVVGLLDDMALDLALRRACVAGAIATTVRGAQPSLPTSDEIDAMLGV